MKGLRREFNVIGLAASGVGSVEDLQITTFSCLRGGSIERKSVKSVVKAVDYLTMLKNSAGYGQKEEADILSFARDLHEYLRDHMELSEAYKPLIVSGILLGLKDNVFENSYRGFSEKDDLASALYEAIKRSLKKAKVRDNKYEAMKANYSFISTNKAVKEHLRDVISKIYRSLFFALLPNSSFDLLGSFYGEFLRYSGGDKQGLGIVLTPRHIIELFADIADLNPTTSVVLDTCAGTGGFLIAAMASMVNKAAGNSAVIENIKAKRLVGVELDQHMFTLACANMIFRGDGKANMFWDDCLAPREEETALGLLSLKPNVALLNPPFSKKAMGKSELAFVRRALDLLQPNGTAVVVLPISALIDDGPQTIQGKKELLEKHTLKAVMSMPPQLFPGVGTVTAIAVLTAHKPHHRDVKAADGVVSPKPISTTWFGYWRDDGYISLKNKRVERKLGLWDEIRETWLENYNEQKEIKGESCKKSVTYTDEWVAEAYLMPDYSTMVKEELEVDLKQYVLQKFMLEANLITGVEDEED